MSSLQNAFDAILAVCNDSTVGYSMGESAGDYPKGSTRYVYVNGNKYVDCSALMAYGLTQGGYFTQNPWFSTVNEETYLTKAGWTQIYPTQISDLRAGDISYYDQGGGAHGHTFMIHSVSSTSYQIMEAKGRFYNSGGVRTFADQVRVTDGHNKDCNPLTSVNWHSGCKWFRDLSGGTAGEELHWTQGADQAVTPTWEVHYMQQSGTPPITQQINNACIIANTLSSYGVSKQMICVILGCMQGESGLNPHCLQKPNGPAYGLSQWEYPSASYPTDWRDYYRPSNYATDADANGEAQMQYYIDGMTGAGNAVQRWYPTSTYTYTWNEWKVLTNIATGLSAYQAEYERGGSPRYSDKLFNANWWFDNWDVWWTQGGVGAPTVDETSGQLKNRFWLIARGIVI